MIEYKNRTYREHLQKERWYSFTVAYKETDLWIGIDQASFQESIPTFTESRIRTLREYMDAYLQNDPDYATSLVSYEAQPGAPTIFQEMSEVARKSGIGPMSAVAGAVASRIGQEIKEKYGVREIIVENGGDIYADIQENIDIAVFAGASPLPVSALGVRLVPCTTVAGHCILPAVPASLCRTGSPAGQGRAEHLYAAFADLPPPPDGWEVLVGVEAGDHFQQTHPLSHD